MYDPSVVIRGTKIVDGKAKVVELSKFEAMEKIIPSYLAAMNIQNKMWGLYTVPEKAAPSRRSGFNERQKRLDPNGAGTAEDSSKRDAICHCGQRRELKTKAKLIRRWIEACNREALMADGIR
jgi:hypothetical protein